MEGKLEIFQIDKQGKQTVLQTVKNTILDSMYEKLVNLFGGTAHMEIDRMQFGTGTIAPAPSQTFLQSAITPMKSVVAETDPLDQSTVVFTAYLEENEANGFPISEAGLVTNDDTLVARTTFITRTKTSSYSFGFRWSVKTRT